MSVRFLPMRCTISVLKVSDIVFAQSRMGLDVGVYLFWYVWVCFFMFCGRTHAYMSVWCSKSCVMCLWRDMW